LYGDDARRSRRVVIQCTCERKSHKDPDAIERGGGLDEFLSEIKKGTVGAACILQ
jgi:hypothetical protein